MSVITLFKPYPVVGDVLLQLSLLPLFYKLLFCTSQSHTHIHTHYRCESNSPPDVKANFVLLNVYEESCVPVRCNSYVTLQTHIHVAALSYSVAHVGRKRCVSMLCVCVCVCFVLTVY